MADKRKKLPAAVELGRLGGKVKSPKKLAAIAENSRKTRRCPRCGHGWRHIDHQTKCKKANRVTK